MKKLFALCLASLFLFITPIDAIASIRNDYSDSDICILTQDSFEGLFNSSTIESVSYDYCITIIDTQRADVHLSYVLEISDSLYTGEVSGQVEGITISASDVVWEGPLYGELAINGHVCAVSIGFAKNRTAIVLNQPDVLPGLYYYATPATTVNFEVTLG